MVIPFRESNPLSPQTWGASLSALYCEQQQTFFFHGVYSKRFHSIPGKIPTFSAFLCMYRSWKYVTRAFTGSLCTCGRYIIRFLVRRNMLQSIGLLLNVIAACCFTFLDSTSCFRRRYTCTRYCDSFGAGTRIGNQKSICGDKLTRICREMVSSLFNG